PRTCLSARAAPSPWGRRRPAPARGTSRASPPPGPRPSTTSPSSRATCGPPAARSSGPAGTSAGSRRCRSPRASSDRSRTSWAGPAGLAERHGAPGVRVLQVIDSLARAGAEQSLAALAPHLVAEGVDLHVAYLVERDDLRPALERAGVTVTSLATPDGRRHRRSWYRRLRRLVAALAPDLVHTTLFEADLAGRRAAAHEGVPCASSLVNSTYDPGQARRERVSPLKLRAAQAADVLTARHVARFHAVTDHVARVMSRRLLVPRSRIEVIPRGRDPEVLGRRDPARARAVRARLGVPDGAPLLVAVGRQEPQKGLDVLLQAL